MATQAVTAGAPACPVDFHPLRWEAIADPHRGLSSNGTENLHKAWATD